MQDTNKLYDKSGGYVGGFGLPTYYTNEDG